MDKMDFKDFISLTTTVEQFMKENGFTSMVFNRVDLNDDYHIGLTVNEGEDRCLVTIQI